MSRAVLTGWTGTLFAKMACYTVPLIESYAQRHGADFDCVNLAGERPPSWHKVEYLMQALHQYDQVVWIDSDVVVERPDKSIFDELPSYAWQAVVAHETGDGIIPNCGIWVLAKPMLPILLDAWNSETYIQHPWWEQAAMLERMGYQVNYNTAHHLRMTPLYAHTAWLDPEWNHHPCDFRRVESPRFRHITMYKDRLAVARECAMIAQVNLEKFS